MGITLNFSNVESKNFDAIPNGAYEALVHDIEETNVKNGANVGAPMWAVQFAINGGQYDNRRVFRNFTVIESSLWAIEQFLVAIGVDPQALKSTDGVTIEPSNLIGAACKIVLRQRIYEGTPTNDVKQIMKSTGQPNASTTSGPSNSGLPFV